ncbi:uncharacterized protein LOC113228024 [Hyposmocoma kahamanoa]|uniref:uncharacterized protein LOC113228024 n=1 Tax=Hyposmocoma kahamanoa TaxID=1477025 RepID=UPI000E6D781C|nr:uncharacterized protein LOC113228024 [Hyposmocoma kahamanoa]
MGGTLLVVAALLGCVIADPLIYPALVPYPYSSSYAYQSAVVSDYTLPLTPPLASYTALPAVATPYTALPAISSPYTALPLTSAYAAALPAAYTTWPFFRR